MEAITDTRKGDWIETYTGRRFYPMDPRPEDICIMDIAHALSLICRFNGHTKHHYSVAQHSVLCAELLIPEHGALTALHALMHDAAEAYVCDIPRPFKCELGGYAEMESAVQDAIYKRFDIPPMSPPQAAKVRLVDNFLLYNEATALLADASWISSSDFPEVKIIKMQPEDAEQRFSALFTTLMLVTRREGKINGTNAG